MKLSDLPTSPFYIIQGASKENITDLPHTIQWIDWRDKNLLTNQLIVGKTMRSLVKNLENQGVFDSLTTKSLETIEKTITLTHSFLNDLPHALNTFREVEEFFDFIKIYNEQKILNQELQWAHYLESQSKSNVGIKRIQRLDGEIIALEKKKHIIKPQYEFLKNSDAQFKQTLSSLNKEVKQVNKSYISKTTQINKLKRQIDAEKPKSDLYTEKLDELAGKISKSKLHDNEDYKRISNKLNNVNGAISQYIEEVAYISEDIILDKTQIKDKKKKLKELKQQNAQTGPKFIEIQKSYMEINSQLKKTSEEKADLIKSQSTDNVITDMGVPPANIRFSSIIEEELKSNAIRLSKYISISEITPEAYLSQFILSWGLNKRKHAVLTTPVDEISEKSLRHFQNAIESIENSLNRVLKLISLKISINKLPFIRQLENSIPLYGIQFRLFKNKKSITFEKLPPEERFYLMCSFEYTLNNNAGIHTHIFVDSDFKIKRTRSLIENTIRLIKIGILAKEKEQKIVIVLSKPILEDKTQKDMIITTLTPK